MMLNSVTLVGMDGAGDRPLITKALNYTMKQLEFKEVLLLSPSYDYDIEDNINLINIKKLDYKEWNKFVIKELYKYINTKHYMFVDIDGFVLNPNKWCDSFLDYDYIGARWWYNDPHLKYATSENLECKTNVGNGGFTLRSKKFLEEASKLTYDGYSPEDAFLCIKSYDKLVSSGIKFAPSDIADKFSTDPYDGKSFGFHGNKNIVNNL